VRCYSKEEWKKLDADVRKRILDNPARKKLREEKSQQRGVSAIGSGQSHPPPSSDATHVSIDKESEDQIVAAVMRGIMASSLSNQDCSVGLVATGTRPTHGSRVGSVVGSVLTGSIRSSGSSVTFDQSQQRP
jgi:hypothetical protein